MSEKAIREVLDRWKLLIIQIIAEANCQASMRDQPVASSIEVITNTL